MLDLLDRLSSADRLRLLAFDAELRRLPRPLIAALWAGADALDLLLLSAFPQANCDGALDRRDRRQ